MLLTDEVSIIEATPFNGAAPIYDEVHSARFNQATYYALGRLDETRMEMRPGMGTVDAATDFARIACGIGEKTSFCGLFELIADRYLRHT